MLLSSIHCSGSSAAFNSRDGSARVVNNLTAAPMQVLYSVRAIITLIAKSYPHMLSGFIDGWHALNLLSTLLVIFLVDA
jgi:hypothetical protein